MALYPTGTDFPHTDYLTSINWDQDRPVFQNEVYNGSRHRRVKHTKQHIVITATYTFYSKDPITNEGGATYEPANDPGIMGHYYNHVADDFVYWRFWEDADIATAREITVKYDGKPKYKRKNSKVYTCTVKFRAVE